MYNTLTAGLANLMCSAFKPSASAFFSSLTPLTAFVTLVRFNNNILRIVQ